MWVSSIQYVEVLNIIKTWRRSKCASCLSQNIHLLPHLEISTSGPHAFRFELGFIIGSVGWSVLPVLILSDLDWDLYHWLCWLTDLWALAGTTPLTLWISSLQAADCGPFLSPWSCKSVPHNQSLSLSFSGISYPFSIDFISLEKLCLIQLPMLRAEGLWLEFLTD